MTKAMREAPESKMVTYTDSRAFLLYELTIRGAIVYYQTFYTDIMNEILKSRFLVLYCMVLADGVIDTRELETLYRIGQEKYNLTNQQISEAVKEAGTSFILPDKLEDKISLLYEMSQICVCDDKIDETEVNLLKRYARAMDFEEENLDGIVQFLIDEAQSGVNEDDVIQKVLG